MTENQKKAELARLEKEWQKEYKKVRKYRLLLKGAEERRTELEKKIREL